jgi:hypothetical protein
MGLAVEESGFDSQLEQEELLLSKGSTQPHADSVPAAISLGLKRPGLETGQIPSSGTPIRLHGGEFN